MSPEMLAVMAGTGWTYRHTHADGEPETPALVIVEEQQLIWENEPQEPWGFLDEHEEAERGLFGG